MFKDGTFAWFPSKDEARTPEEIEQEISGESFQTQC
jgi:hypothetical protein